MKILEILILIIISIIGGLIGGTISYLLWFYKPNTKK